MKLIKTTSEQSAKRIPILVPNLTSLTDNKAEQGFRKIALPTMEGIHFEKVEEIVSLEAKGNYTNLHFINRKKLLVCKTLLEMENVLNAGNQFVRIHRSFTVAKDKIESIESNQLQVDGVKYVIGRQYINEVKRILLQ